MALSVVNFATGGIGSAAQIISANAANNTTGNLLVVAFSNFFSNVFSVTDTAENDFILINSLEPYDGNAGLIYLYYAKNIIGNPSNVVTVETNGNCELSSIAVWEVSGADPLSPLDTDATGITDSSLVITSNAYSTTNANDIIIASMVSDAFAPYTAQVGYTLDSELVGGGLMGAQHLVVSSIQAGITTSASNTSSIQQGILVATFKAAPSVIVTLDYEGKV